MRKQAMVLIITLFLFPSCYAGQVEVLHYWTSGGEAAAADVLKNMLTRKGHTWKDFVVEGADDHSAYEELKQRLVRGTPPSSAMVKGLDIERWARLGFLQRLDDLAERERWDSLLSPFISDVVKFRGHYVSTPVNVHRTNWMWINKKILQEVGVGVPTTWAEFISSAKRIKAKGYQVVAHGDQAWQYATVFESVALAVGGPDFYRKAFIDLDHSVIKGYTMEAVFAQFREILPYMQSELSSDDWHIATKAVIDGEAAFQFMGDWAKGEFKAAGKKVNKDYICAPMPETRNRFVFNIDTLVMFELKEPADQLAQMDLASEIMSEDFQILFNQKKGSIPVRKDISMEQFDECARASKREFTAAEAGNSLVPSIAHGMATLARVKDEFYAVIHEFADNAEMSSKVAAVKLAKRMRYGSYVID